MKKLEYNCFQRNIHIFFSYFYSSECLALHVAFNIPKCEKSNGQQ